MDHALYVALFQAESTHVLNSLLIGLNSLQKPQLLVTENYTFPLHLKLGYSELAQPIADEASFEQILNKAFSLGLPTIDGPKIDADIGLTTEQILRNVELSLLQKLRKEQDIDELHLQQKHIYDKQDHHLHT